MSFTSKGSAIVILKNYKPTAVEADIPDYFITAADQEINQRSDTQWEIDIVDRTFLINGTGERHIHVPTVPIVSLTSVSIIHNDETETSLAVSGAKREVRFNAETGQIVRVRSENDIFVDDDDEFNTSRFVEGVENIKVVGKFGRDEVADLLRLLANMIILRNMGRLDPNNYKVNLISEKIGKYQYTSAHIDRATKGNEPLTLDGFINYLFGLLPQDDSIFIEAV